VFNANAVRDDLLEPRDAERFGRSVAGRRVARELSTLTDPSEKQHGQLWLKRLDGLLTPGGRSPAQIGKCRGLPPYCSRRLCA